MRRSQVNEIIGEAVAFLAAQRFFLPPFAFWQPAQWRERSDLITEILERGLGWDITDFGLGRFGEQGLTLFTLRNGDREHLGSSRSEVYAEKALIVEKEQITPLHFHWVKTEDIINRGGGKLALQLFNAAVDDGVAGSAVHVRLNSIPRRLRAGEVVLLEPGDSIRLTPRLYHAFWAEDERVLVGEVSSVNDDATDNRFYEDVGRFPTIEEDEPPARLLVGDYERLLTGRL